MGLIATLGALGHQRPAMYVVMPTGAKPGAPLASASRSASMIISGLVGVPGGFAMAEASSSASSFDARAGAPASSPPAPLSRRHARSAMPNSESSSLRARN